MPVNEGHTVLLSRAGEMYVCGRNRLGGLGIGNVRTQKTLVKVESPPFACISTGDHHTVGVTHDGTVWGCGCDSLGELGHIIDGPDYAILTVMIQLPGLCDIKSVATGYNSTILLGNDGRVSVMGKMFYPIVYQDTLFKVLPISVAVKQISAGTDYCLMLDVQGYVHWYGHDKIGVLGHGNQNIKQTPTKISNLSDIVSIASGMEHNLCLDSFGDVYGFGGNCCHELVIENTDVILTPSKINSNISKIDCGGHYSIFWDYDRDVWMCGDNSEGEMGFYDPSYTGTLRLCNYFKNMEIIPGLGHTFSISPEGNIYSCGSNYHYRCGQPKQTPSYKPIEFTLIDYTNFRLIHKIKSATTCV